MSPEFGFELHPEAAKDIIEIWEYVAEDSPLAAERVREEILDAIRRLVPVPDCVCARRVKRLRVIVVMHRHRNPRVMAAVLRSRE